MIIRYARAPSGAGKTHSIVTRACELARDQERVVILQPTKELINKTVAEELQTRINRPRYRVFHQDVVFGRSIAGEMTRFFREPEECSPQIVFATHQVLPYIPFIANKRDWHLLIDEELPVVRYRCHQIFPHLGWSSGHQPIDDRFSV
jgi:superfamily II DNA or RNA helicase